MEVFSKTRIFTVKMLLKVVLCGDGFVVCVFFYSQLGRVAKTSCRQLQNGSLESCGNLMPNVSMPFPILSSVAEVFSSISLKKFNFDIILLQAALSFGGSQGPWHNSQIKRRVSVPRKPKATIKVNPQVEMQAIGCRTTKASSTETIQTLK